ncbi:MAG: hypothetical protein DSY33_04475 [Archaeoglobus sp.]|nr:MAG: hypothetical protein DSY33_04475 [Archaeoglobus sp.]
MLELTQIQRDILYALVTLYKKKSGYSIKGEEIAELINRNPGTVRNQMQALRALGLVEGVPGPKGGYRPTAKAYEVLSITHPEESVVVPVTVNGRILDASAEEIDLPSLSHPTVCTAKIRLIGDIRTIKPGDEIIIGPTPVNELMVWGKVTGRDDTSNSILISIDKIFALPKDTVEKHMSYPIITVSAEQTVMEAGKVLAENNIHCAPVRKGNSFIGMICLLQVAKALADGRLNSLVVEYMIPRVVFVEKTTRIREAIRIMREENVRTLVVTDSGEPVGVITIHRILTELSPEQVKKVTS